jgi:hypothetical protein
MIKQGRQGIFTDLNSLEIYRDRISLGGPVCSGPRMSKNIPSALYFSRTDYFSQSLPVQLLHQPCHILPQIP